MLPQPLIFRQGHRIPGPKLADALVQKLSPGLRPSSDQIQILWTEKDSIQNAGQFPRVFQPDAVGQQLSTRPPVQGRLQGKVSPPAGHLSFDEGMVHTELDQLPVVPRPVGRCGGQISYRFQQIGLSLGVVSKDDVDPRMKSRLQVEVVSKKIQGNGLDNHSTTRAICPPSSTRSPGRSFFPRMVHT